MLQRIFDFVDRHQMLAQKDKIIAGISGGADSVCLLCVLRELRERYDLSIEALHVNHTLRGQEAEEDAAFTEELCRRFDIPCQVYRYPVKALAEEWGCSLEEAGRRVRMEAFYRRLRETGADKIALAHHQDDRAETMLFHLFRGTGLKGLSSMRPVSVLPAVPRSEQCSSQEDMGSIPLIRPLLCVGREDIEALLKEQGLPFRVDSSNEEDAYTRNKIRHHVLSYVREEISPGAVENMNRTAGQLEKIYDYLEKNAKEGLREGLCKQDSRLYLSAEVLAARDPVIRSVMATQCIREAGGSLRDVTETHIRGICGLLEKKVGKQLSLPGGLVVKRTYDALMFAKEDGQQRQKEPVKETPVTVPGRYVLEETGETITFTKKTYNKMEKIPISAYTKWFDYDKIKNPMKIRTRRKGDFLTVSVSGGRKKLKDYLIDCKLPAEERDGRLLLASGDHVLWVFGLRTSEAFRVTEDTKEILVVTRTAGRDAKDE